MPSYATKPSGPEAGYPAPQGDHPAPKRRPTRDYAPRKRKSRGLAVLPLLLLFTGLLALAYLIFPGEPAGYAGPAMYNGLVISEVMAANSSAVPDETGVFPDWLEIYNGTGRDLDLEDVMITNRNDRITFSFPSRLLKAGDRVVVFASGRRQQEPGKPYHGKFKISAMGDHLYLFDPHMNLIDHVATPAMASNTSYQLKRVGEGGQKEYEVTPFYAPGYENSEDGFIAYRNGNAAQGGVLVISEACPDPRLSIPDEDGDIADWVELHNTSDRPIPLGGYYLSNNERKPMKWRFPDGVSIPAQGYYLVFCSRKDKMQGNGIPHTSFGISAKRSTLVLSDPQGRLVDRVFMEDIPTDYSIGRNGDGDWDLFAIPTPGFSNDSQGQNRADELLRAYNPTGVYISEVLASNSTIPLGNSGIRCDFVELYNASDKTVDLSLYGLSDRIKRPRKWQFPQGASIEPGEHKVIFCDGNTSLSTFYEFHTNFKIRRAGGETITFCDPAGRVLDRIPLSLIPTDHSYGRTFGSPGFYYYNTPTPGAANSPGYYGYTANPSFSAPGGEYKGDLRVSILIPKDTVVTYTLDGTVPTESDRMYNEGEAFSFTRVTVLRARAFDPSGRLQPSEIITQTYFLNLYHTMPILSVVADPNELWNPETGMLTVGEDVDKSKGIPFKNTVYRQFGKINRPGHVEMYGTEGDQQLSQNMEFCLSGSYSLDMPQKSMKFRSKAKHGAKYFEASLFEDRPFARYRGFVLRISGNDAVWTRLNDAMQHQLIGRFNEEAGKAGLRPTDLVHQAWRPVVVYLNGIYWGHYNLRERPDRYMVAQWEGIGLDRADEMDLLQANFKTLRGTNREYTDMIKKVKTLSPGKNEKDLQYILDRVDVDNYFDYMAFEMFFGNSDNGNIRYYKLKEEGSKWKWLVYDLDYGLFRSGFDSPTSYLKAGGAGQQKIDNTLIRKLLENDRMQDQFLTRLGEIYQVFTTEFMTGQLNAMAAVLEPEMAMHFARWAEENDRAINVDSPLTPEGAMRYWNTRLDFTRNVLKKRPTYFYEMVQERFGLTNEQMLTYFGEKPPLPADAIYTEGRKWS
ncbi:MAG: lamin tail domain-containing protein [Clostridia bacterium]|nr:lamin tail domain-containing protein [Clostridia bacterium]